MLFRSKTVVSVNFCPNGLLQTLSGSRGETKLTKIVLGCPQKRLVRTGVDGDIARLSWGSKRDEQASSVEGRVQQGPVSVHG